MFNKLLEGADDTDEKDAICACFAAGGKRFYNCGRGCQSKKLKGFLDCTKAAPANIQYNGKKVLGQEGMLTLDIVRPDTQEKNLPVLVYIHGGNNQASNSHLTEGY